MTELSKRTLRRIDMLKNICDFDLENKVATIHMHFESAEEMLDLSVGNLQSPVLNSDAMHLLRGTINAVPIEFAVDVSVKIDDYGDYDKQSLIQAYKSAAETLNYRKKIAQNKKTSVICSFCVIGILFLIFSIISKNYHLFSFMGSLAVGIITLFIELVFEVFFEEGLGLFIFEKCFGRYIKSHINRFRNVKFT